VPDFVADGNDGGMLGASAFGGEKRHRRYDNRNAHA
jgi:hypothetical protein